MKHARFAVAVSFLFLGLSAASWAQDQSLPYYQAGNSFYAQRNYDQAIRYYQAAAQMNPQFWQAFQGEGNCYYAKEDRYSALENYEKALRLNSNNAQLSSFVQTIQAQIPAPPPQPADPGIAGGTGPTPSKNFELQVGAGLGLASNASSEGYSTDFGFGYGGRVRALYLAGRNLEIGGSFSLFNFSKGYFGGSYSLNTSSLEVSPTIEFKFDGTGVRPYGVFGLGFSVLSESFSSSSYSGPAASQVYPMIQAGGGVEFAAGKNMAFFGEVKYVLVFVGTDPNSRSPGSSYSYIPLEVGMSFDL